MTLKEELQQEEITYSIYSSQYVTFTEPVRNSELNICDGVLIIQTSNKMPNPIVRFFQYWCLGFKWKKL